MPHPSCPHAGCPGCDRIGGAGPSIFVTRQGLATVPGGMTGGPALFKLLSHQFTVQWSATLGTALGQYLEGTVSLATHALVLLAAAGSKRRDGGATVMTTLMMLVAIFTGSGPALGEWKRLPPLPDKEGFAGPFAGVSRDVLLVAGGANFPVKRPWEGGKKVWYDTIFALDRPDGEWRAVGKLPRPLGYGVSATHRASVVCVGGSDSDRHHADAFRLEWKAGQVVSTPLPPLPRPVANACGAIVGDTLYVAGGQATPDATVTLKTVYRLDLAAEEPRWREIEPWPGGARMLAVAASTDGAFWLAGGADLVAEVGGKVERRYLKDAYRYDSDRGWKRIADMPHPAVGAPSPAPADGSGFFVLGGDDGSKVGFTPPERHPGFARTILRFDVKTEMWSEAGGLPAPRVTAPPVRWDDAWVIPGGEVRPGVRSPEVWSFSPR
jgi:N-acetylneuraminate epimerase